MPPKSKGKAVVPAGAHISVPDRPAQTMTGARAIDLPTYLARIIPAYGHPGWLEATRWRQIVRNQPLCIVLRDTLIDNLKNLEWDIVPADTEMTGNKEIKKAIQYYADLFEQAEGDFDSYLDLMGQDLMDLPFGAACEIGREDDDPNGPVLWINHIDGSTLLPSYDPDYPVIQSVPGMIGQAIAFPKHAIDRVMYTPRPELRRKGWGMAPPEKVYLSVEMLFRGDTYYWKLLLDTPEAGVLDLIDMDEDAANKWIGGFRELFQGIDGFKVPVLHSHDKPAVWIPFNRPPTELLYDKAVLHYAALLAAGYGMRIGDIGLQESGRGTLAGVIREERQTRRSGLANVREKFRNHFNRILPHDQNTSESLLRFVWIERDDETLVSRGRAFLAVNQAFQAGIGAGIISSEEARKELIAMGLMETDIDPNKIPTPPANPLLGGGSPFGGKPGGNLAGAPGAQNEKKQASIEGSPPPSAGGRGETPKPQSMPTKTLVDRVRGFLTRAEPKPGTPFGKNPATKDATELLKMMEEIVAPGMARIPERAGAVERARILKLVHIATKAMVPKMVPIVRSLNDRDLKDYWVPEYTALTFDEPTELDALDFVVIRQQDDDVKALIEAALIDEEWYQLADEWDRQSMVDLYAAAFSRGATDQAVSIAKAAYVGNLINSPDISIDFNLTNPATLGFLEQRAGDLVTHIDEGTVTFIKRIIVAGVNQGLSSPEIAQALRDGATAERVLTDEGYINDVLDSIMGGLTDMSEARTNSIVNYEVAWGENAGKYEQLVQNGLQTKAWAHLGERGYTDKGNLHPCQLCERNEAEGWVPIDYQFETVFGGADFPPAHPNVCHCTILFNPDELARVVAEGKFAPWLGN